MEPSPRFIALVILLLFIFLTPEQSTSQRHLVDNNVLDTLKRAEFDVIANSSYGDIPEGGLDLTGFRPDDQYQWQLLPFVQYLSRLQHKQGRVEDAPIYDELSGTVKGTFAKRLVALDEARQLNLTRFDPFGDYLTHTLQRNVTDQQGDITITLEDSKPDGRVRDITATISIYSDSAPGAGWEVTLRGIHLAKGDIILTTTSRKYNAIPAIPHFVLEGEDFEDAKSLINSTVARLWKDVYQERRGSLFPKCELIVWLQQKSQASSARYLQQLEDELRNPEGAPIGKAPPMAFAATIFSPDCGYVLEADPVYGPKAELYWKLTQRLLIAFIIVMVLQLYLLKRQMEKCATPSTRSRISYHGIGIAAFGDGLIFFAVVGLLMFDSGAALLLVTAAFLCCMHFAFFEVKFIFDIWTVQVGDPAQAQRDRQRRQQATSELPAPVTAQTEPVIVPLDQDTDSPRQSLASLYSRFYFALVNLMFFSLWATSWPPTLRSFYANVLAFCYFSLWTPQIYRNAMRNCRKALNWEYIIGTSILRAVPVLYWYVDDKNILAAKANPNTALILLLWLWMQVSILISQQYLGPRLLVKESWCPPAYDYHPLLYNDLEAGGMPIGELASASEGKDKDDKTRKVFDCAICMNEIDVPVAKRDEDKGRSWLEQSNYMVTPCRHIFHSECLEGWMNLRLVCPVCREGLPPL